MIVDFDWIFCFDFKIMFLVDFVWIKVLNGDWKIFFGKGLGGKYFCFVGIVVLVFIF